MRSGLNIIIAADDMARLEGLEPPISRFVAAHSIRLSYRRIRHFGMIA